MNKKLYDDLKELNTDKMSWELANLLRGKLNINKFRNAAAALAYISIDNRKGLNIVNSKYKEEVNKILDKYNELYTEDVRELLDKYSTEELLAYIIFDDERYAGRDLMYSTPKDVCELVAKVLDIKSSDRVLELCSGIGVFSTIVKYRNSDVSYKGVDIDYDCIELAILKSHILEMDVEFNNQNVIDYNAEEKADKIFANYPFGVRFTKEEREGILRKINGLDEAVVRRITSDWFFNLLMLNQLKDSGKAVAIMTNRATWNINDKDIRKYFVENGYIEAIIALPDKLFEFRNIPLVMVVLSKNNEKIKMIDASDKFTPGRMNNTLTDTDIESIVNLLVEDSDLMVSMTSEELMENDYILNPSRYLQELPDIKDGVEFGSIITNISRGSQLKADAIEELKCGEVTDYQYLLLSNIDNGLIDVEDNQYLKEIPKRLEKYCVKNNSIVISKIGSPKFKSAVVEVKEGEKLLANGNLLVIEIDEEKANPYFIQAYLASEVGNIMINNSCAGETIPTMSMDSLKKMIVPLPSLKEQKKVASEYVKRLNEVRSLRDKLSEALYQMNTVYKLK